MKVLNFFVVALLLLVNAACLTGSKVKDVDFPATPIDMTKITKVGKACFNKSAIGTNGNGSVIEAARNGGLRTVRMVEYSDEFEAGGFIQKTCTTVYGD